MAARNPKDDRDDRVDGTEPVPKGTYTHEPDAPAGRLEEERVTPELTRDDVMAMPVEDLAERVGLEPPGPGDDEAAWREMAWRSHAQDVQNRDEWGTATQATEPPEGEEPNL